MSGALQVVHDIAVAPENLPGLQPVLGHVSLFQGDWRLPAILQQWAAHMAIYHVFSGHSNKYTTAARASHTRPGLRAP